MTVSLNGKTYLTTKEAAEKLEVSKQTLLRWFSEGKVNDVKKRDRNGWRLFTVSDISRIKKWKNEASR